LLDSSQVEEAMSHAAANIVQRAADTQHVRARGSAVRALYERGLTWVSLDPIPDLACGADIAMRRLPGLGLQSGRVWGNRHRHRPDDVTRGVDDFSIHINLSGLSIVAGRGREITLRDGDAVLFSYAETRTVTRPGLCTIASSDCLALSSLRLCLISTTPSCGQFRVARAR
jgi:hypothetical protein